MNQQGGLIITCFFFIMMFCVQLNAQTKPVYGTKKKKTEQQKPTLAAPNQDDIINKKDTSDIIQLKHADEIEGFETGTESIRFLKGNVVFFQKDAFFYCDSAYLYQNQNAIHAWGKVTIIQSDTIEVFSDTLKYFGDDKDAFLIGNVILTDTAQQIFTERLDYNLRTKIAKYETGGLLRQSDTQLTSTYGTYDAKTDKAYFMDSVVVINDKFTLKSDSLLYDTETKKSTFLGPTLILQDSAKIYCESGYYDYSLNKAEFNTNPQYIKGEKIAVSDQMSYDGETKIVTLVGNAKFKENEKIAKSDRMIYDEEKDITRLIGNAYFKDEEQEVTADVIIYDGKDESYTTEGKTIAIGKDNYVEADNSSYDKATNTTTLTGNVLVADSTQILQAELVEFNNETKAAYAKGKVNWQDTVNHVTIQSNELFYNDKTDYVKAIGRPLMTTIMDGDTLFLSADTLISETVVLDSLDTISRIVAYYDVRMYKNDFQAVCDSLNYNSTDSIFHFYDKPVLWSDSSQFSADTVRIILKEEALDSVFLMNKALIVETPDEIYFNQIKGKNILINFEASKPKKMNVNGNGESIYYIQDDDGGYVGPNKTTCSDMYLYFDNGELQTIRFLVEPEGEIHPMKEANHNEMKVPGFKWESKKRPNSPADLNSPYYLGKEYLEAVPEPVVSPEPTDSTIIDIELEIESESKTEEDIKPLPKEEEKPTSENGKAIIRKKRKPRKND